MAGTFYGADVAQLRSLAARAGSGAGSLGSLQRRLGAEIAGSAYWQGHDAGAFRSEWDRVHAQSLARAVAGLQQMQRELTAHADQQESASAAAGAPAPSGGALDGGSTPLSAPPSVLLTPAALSALTPHQVGRWWAGLDAAGRADFLRLYPYAAGNTDGLPVDTRIEANRVAAGTRLAELEREGKGSTEEAHYLRKTVKGTSAWRRTTRRKVTSFR
ncbi:WXG100 family type VII secretion target [Arthrobacter sp. 1P04PC]|uniref:WXG100 family type VII secretion target n=1 Tax=unclassified Arthrobacter TaxID=235627 RepID=UPI0039A0A184